MKKILFRAFILCTLIPSMWLSAANAVSEDAECLSLTTEAGATFSVCLEGDDSKTKLLPKETLKQLLKLARQLKKAAAQANTANEGLNDTGSSQTPPAVVPTTPDYSDYYPVTKTPTVTETPDYTDYYPVTTTPTVTETPDYTDYYPVITTPTVTETPDYTDYYPDNSVTPEVNEPDPYDMCALYPSYPGCSS